MASVRWIAGLGLGVLGAAGTMLAPALQAQGSAQRVAAVQASPSLRGVSGFTPAAADPKLAALLASTRMANASFRFTPAEALGADPARAVTMTSRSRAANAGSIASPVGRAASGVPEGGSFQVAPIKYNLGNTDRAAHAGVPADIAKIDLGAQGSPLRTDLGLGKAARQAPLKVAPSLTAERSAVEAPRMLSDSANQGLEVGGSFALTRRLDVTAGVRYMAERDRLRMPQINDDRRDSQAVYVGTAFRF